MLKFYNLDLIHLTWVRKICWVGRKLKNFFLFSNLISNLEHDCKDFRCQLKEFCIHPDLICDGVNHCGDASDENVSAMCQSEYKKN